MSKQLLYKFPKTFFLKQIIIFLLLHGYGTDERMEIRRIVINLAEFSPVINIITDHRQKERADSFFGDKAAETCPISFHAGNAALYKSTAVYYNLPQ